MIRFAIPVFLCLALSASALDDPPPAYELGLHLPVVYENEGGVSIPVKRRDVSAPVPHLLRVTLAARRGSVQYEQYLHFDAGMDTTTAVFPIENDIYYGGQPVEWSVLLIEGTGTLLDQSEVTTVDDEPRPRLTTERVQVSETDANQSVQVTLTIEPAYRGSATSHFMAEAQTAGEHDFQPGFLSVSWPPMQSSTTVSLVIKGDDLPENNETFLLKAGPMGDVAVEIVDDDRPPYAFAFESTDYTFDETSAGSVKIVRTGTPDPATVTMLFLGVTAVEWPQPVTLDFAAGETSKVVPLDFDDAWYTGKREANLALEWSGLRGTTARLTVHDDEARPALTIGDASVVEGASGETTHAQFELTLSAPVGAPLVVGVGTEHGTARSEDYVPLTSSVAIPAGALSAKVTVHVRGDAAQEPDETFALNITSCCGGLAELARNKAAGVIRNDDGGSSAAFALEAAARVEERIGWFEAVVTRTAGTADTTATVKLVADAARPFAPVNVRFRAGEQRKTVRWYLDDRVHSGDAHATLEVYAGTRRDDSRAVQIIDDERTPTIKLHETTVARIDGSPGPRLTAKFLITIDPPVWTDVQMQISTYSQGSSNGWAKVDEFEAVNRILTIPAGATKVEVPVWVQGSVQNSQRIKGFLLRMNFLGPAGVQATIPYTEARAEFVAMPGSGAAVGAYDRYVPVGGTQKVVVQLPTPAVIADSMKLESSDPSILTVPPSVMVVPGSTEVAFEATGIARGAANVKITLPVFYQGEQLLAPLDVITIHVPSASPSYLVMRPGETVRVSVAAMPVSMQMITGTVEAKNKSIVFVQPDLQVGAIGSFTVYGANAGKTEILVRFADDAGATELRIPVEVTDADARRRGVRH